MSISPDIVEVFLQNIKENGTDNPEATASDLLSAIRTTVEVDGLSEEDSTNLRLSLEMLIPFLGLLAAKESNEDPKHVTEICKPYFELLHSVTLNSVGVI